MENFLREAKQRVIKTLYADGGVIVDAEHLFTLKGGTLSPVFFDSGILESDEWSRGHISSALSIAVHTFLHDNQLTNQAFVGVVSGGVSWASCLAANDCLPLLRAHAQPKRHGLQNQIDGVLRKEGDNVVVIDDVLTSGTSVLSVVKALREGEGKKHANVLGVYTILDWNLESVNKKFEETGVIKCSLLTAKEVLDYGFKHNLIEARYHPCLQKFMDEHL